MRTALLIATLIATHAAFAADAPGDADQRFRALTEADWNWTLKDSPFTATAIGVDGSDDLIDEVDEASYQRRLAHRLEVQKALQAIDPKALSAGERVNYRIFASQVDSAIDSIRLGSQQIPFNSDSAFYTDVLQWPRSQPFSDAASYRRYLARLARVPRYFEQEIGQMRAGIKRGMVLPKAVLAGRDAPIATEAERRDATTSPLYQPFVDLPATIPAADAVALRAEAVKVIGREITPAYARLLKFFRETYLPAARATLAATALPDGRAYYRRQIIDYTTLDLTPEAVHATGLSEVARIHAEMQAVIDGLKFDGDFAAFLKFLRTDPQFYAKSPEELLMRASWIAKRVDAQLPKFFGTLPRRPFGIEPVPEAIAPVGSSRVDLQACKLEYSIVSPK